MSKDDLVKKGQAVYTAHCAACHQASGAGLPPTFPSLHGDKVTNGPAEAHITQILKGLNLMPPFAQLSDEEIAAVATFERTSWGNKGSVIQPSQEIGRASCRERVFQDGKIWVGAGAIK